MESLTKIANYFKEWDGEEETGCIDLTTQDLRDIAGLNVLNYKLKRELEEYKKIVKHLEIYHPDWTAIILNEIESM